MFENSILKREPWDGINVDALVIGSHVRQYWITLKIGTVDPSSYFMARPIPSEMNRGITEVYLLLGYRRKKKEIGNETVSV